MTVTLDAYTFEDNEKKIRDYVSDLNEKFRNSKFDIIINKYLEVEVMHMHIAVEDMKEELIHNHMSVDDIKALESWERDHGRMYFREYVDTGEAFPYNWVYNNCYYPAVVLQDQINTIMCGVKYDIEEMLYEKYTN